MITDAMKAIATGLIGLVRFYRLAISPMLAPRCRYWPSCSEYAIEALERHGALRGGALAVRRLCRCHPWSAGGIDNVPLVNPPGRTPISDSRWRAYQEDAGAEHSTDPTSR